MEEDNLALRGNKLQPFSNERHAVIMLRGEKEVLHHYVKMAEVGIKILGMSAMDVALAQLDKSRGLTT